MREGGYATVLAAVLALILLAVAGGVLALGQAVIARQGAAAAADLAAVSAATTAMAGGAGDAACSTAAATAVLAQAELIACRVDDGGVTVEVRKPLPAWLADLSSPDGHVHASARAGPP